jgi:hypothetical protein
MRSVVLDAIIVCGGAGLRLRKVTGNAPKSMASVAGRPFWTGRDRGGRSAPFDGIHDSICTLRQSWGVNETHVLIR